MPLSDYLDLSAHDKDTVESLHAHRAEECGECGVHPSVWRKDEGGHPNAIAAEWIYCRACELIAIARDSPPMVGDKPKPGYHLALKYVGQHTH